MAVELITGSAGTPHISGDDVGHLLAGTVGVGSYVLPTGSQLKATMPTVTSLTVADGDAVLHGRHIRVSSPTTVTIDPGTQGQKRNDLVCLRYARTTNASGQTVETATLDVLKGTPTTGTPADPTAPGGNVLSGASEDWMALWRVSLNGVNASAPVKVFNTMSSLAGVRDSVADVRDSVSQRFYTVRRILRGSTLIRINGIGAQQYTTSQLITSEAWRDLTGRALDITRDAVFVCNGDWSAAGVAITSAFLNGGVIAVVHAAAGAVSSRLIRVNWMIVTGT